MISKEQKICYIQYIKSSSVAAGYNSKYTVMESKYQLKEPKQSMIGLGMLYLACRTNFS